MYASIHNSAAAVALIGAAVHERMGAGYHQQRSRLKVNMEAQDIQCKLAVLFLHTPSNDVLAQKGGRGEGVVDRNPLASFVLYINQESLCRMTDIYACS
jgi:hypothetical protein